VIFFIDENIPKNIAKMLNCFEQKHTIRPYLDHFQRGVKDIEWMKTVVSWGDLSTVVTADCRILSNKVERRALKESKLMFVFLKSAWTHLEWNDYCWKIIKVWPSIISNVEQATFPTIFEVTAGNLKVETLSLTKDL
jgi:hypothetical protein